MIEEEKLCQHCCERLIDRTLPFPLDDYCTMCFSAMVDRWNESRQRSAEQHKGKWFCPTPTE
jgi:hypothetical protein